jgi:uncharacterized protein YuzE
VVVFFEVEVADELNAEGNVVVDVVEAENHCGIAISSASAALCCPSRIKTWSNRPSKKSEGYPRQFMAPSTRSLSLPVQLSTKRADSTTVPAQFE